ncbi:hypothetical protein [Halosolutus gelatinilyticus]|uniref:hypothetical protein n=1 Tax=Halosolutus gelatinilyticus TaxID=2931975 RepID=UPI001FF36480|nr:hypothetical protein [Halosolutus gelatinilyticus]
MGTRTDAALAGLSLSAFVVALGATDAPLSAAGLVLGGAGTIAFELVATRHYRAVRRVWERPAVQAGSLAGALAIAVGGAVVAPSIVLSAGVGALVTYLLFLAVAAALRA